MSESCVKFIFILIKYKNKMLKIHRFFSLIFLRVAKVTADPIFEKLFYYSSSSRRADTVCQGSSDPPEKIFHIFASDNEVYTNYYNTLGWILFVYRAK